RAQRIKEQIGFESQEQKQRDKDTADFRKAKAEARKDEVHQARMALLISKNTHQELKNQQLRANTTMFQGPESRLGAANEVSG
ncbi:MAG: hypothetical protein JOZ62_24035, partial [Acidobacteriaceae bacterium]|nr:hypothetical protein [Acidobacteriaceae bacterium]